MQGDLPQFTGVLVGNSVYPPPPPFAVRKCHQMSTKVKRAQSTSNSAGSSVGSLAPPGPPPPHAPRLGFGLKAVYNQAAAAPNEQGARAREPP
jgi:hypothetical protein